MFGICTIPKPDSELWVLILNSRFTSISYRVCVLPNAHGGADVDVHWYYHCPAGETRLDGWSSVISAATDSVERRKWGSGTARTKRTD